MLELLKNDTYWENAFLRLSLKQHLSQTALQELYLIKEVRKPYIIQEFLDGVYNWGTPIKLRLAKSGTDKKRVVYLYPMEQRLFLGVLYQVFSEYYKDLISENCFSYKKSVSAINAISYIQANRRDKIAIKLDIHAYFNSVSQKRLLQMLTELDLPIGIYNSLYTLFTDNQVLDNNIKIVEYKGLIPGTALASFFANYCLNGLDKELLDKGLIYARYSDDILLMADNKFILEDSLQLIQNYLANFGLSINEAKYEWFDITDTITFLGMDIYENGIIDICKHTKQKMKKNIHRWCKKARREIELGNLTFAQAAKRVTRQLNNKNFKCFINNENAFGWCHYVFKYINTTDSLKELDYYTRDTLRYLKTGKHNRANYTKITNDEFKDIGWVSLVELYILYKQDYDYYCEIIELL